MQDDHEHAVCGEVRDNAALVAHIRRLTEQSPVEGDPSLTTVDYNDLSLFADTIAALTAQGERQKQEIAAYRLLAVNEGWNWRMVDAYGHAEYAAQHIEEIDRKARGTIASGYDAQKWLDDHSRALAGEGV